MFHQLIGFEFCCCGALVWLSLCLWKGFSILTTIPNRSFHTKSINFKIQKKKLSTFLFYFERRNRLLWNRMDANNVCMQSYNSRWIKFEWMPSLRFKKKIQWFIGHIYLNEDSFPLRQTNLKKSKMLKILFCFVFTTSKNLSTLYMKQVHQFSL